MKSAEARDAMVGRVQATFDKYRTFQSLPEVTAADAPSGAFTEVVNGIDEAAYVATLYKVCARGEVIGRIGNQVVAARD